MRTLNDATIKLIQSFEGFRDAPYEDIAGHMTVGYGHLIKSGEVFDAPITGETATELMRDDLEDAQLLVEKRVFVHLDDNEYGALTSLVYNVGEAPLLDALGYYINDLDMASAADEFLKYNKYHSNGVLAVSPGLTRRRQAERDLFLSEV